MLSFFGIILAEVENHGEKAIGSIAEGSSG
jgi:hypothetical protein